jgi:hypothetical protein
MGGRVDEARYRESGFSGCPVTIRRMVNHRAGCAYEGPIGQDEFDEIAPDASSKTMDEKRIRSQACREKASK